MEIVPAVLTPSGIAVDTHERFLAISDARKLTVSLYSLPDCLHVRTVGCGVVTEFKEPRKMCFATNGDLLIADNTKQRVQVLSADLSIHRRNIGVGVIDGWIAGLTSNDTLIATCKSGSGRQVHSQSRVDVSLFISFPLLSLMRLHRSRCLMWRLVIPCDHSARAGLISDN